LSIIAIKSVPLWKETNVAWKTVPDFWFIDRARDPDSVIRHINSRQYEAAINLGRTDIRTDAIGCPVYNRVGTIRAISTPRALRKTIPDFIPASNLDMPHWHKARGFGGKGKRFCRFNCTGATTNEDIQVHIEGMEYRIVTVGDVVVQAARKSERRPSNDGRNTFTYTWIGVDGIRKDGFIPFLKEAITEIPDGDKSVLGWDVLHDGTRPWIIETNTSPGVNAFTAARIVGAIRRQLDD
jgi:hypothetical protein